MRDVSVRDLKRYMRRRASFEVVEALYVAKHWITGMGKLTEEGRRELAEHEEARPVLDRFGLPNRRGAALLKLRANPKARVHWKTAAFLRHQGWVARDGGGLTPKGLRLVDRLWPAPAAKRRKAASS